jgi:hypothetical protein
MPAVSKAQFKAMAAAAHGNSTLGIPKAVGQEFVDATKAVKALPERIKPAAHHLLKAVNRRRGTR